MTKLELIEMIKDYKDDEEFIVSIWDKDFVEEKWGLMTASQWSSVVASSCEICWTDITEQVDCLVDSALAGN